LAHKDELTDAESSKFGRLKAILSTSDLNKCLDMYSKLTGAYEAEKHEVTTKFKVNFGGATNQDDTIDID